MKIRTKLLLGIIPIMVLCIAMITFNLVNRSAELQKESAYTNADEMCGKYAEKISFILTDAMLTANTLANLFVDIDKWPIDKRRELISNSLKTTLEKNGQYNAVWSTWEPNAIDNMDSKFINTPGNNETGRFTATWAKVKGQLTLRSDSEQETAAADYYQTPKKLMCQIIQEPSYYSYTGDKKDEIFTSGVVVPIINGGKFLGVVGVDFPIDELQRISSSIKPYGTGYAFVLSNAGVFITHPNASLIGKNISEIDVEFNKANNVSENIKNGKKFSFFKKSSATGILSKTVFVPVSVGQSQTPWCMGISVPEDKILEPVNEIKNYALVVGISGTIIVILILLWLTQNISKTLNSLNLENEKAISAILDGDLKYKADELAVNFEFRPIIAGLNKVIEVFIKQLNSTSDYMERISVGDIPKQITEEYKGDFNRIKTSINNCIFSIKAIVECTERYIDYIKSGEIEKIKFDETQYKGDYKKVITGLNEAARETVTPLAEALGVLINVSNGDLSVKVNGNYRGGFDKLKEVTNAVIATIKSINTEIIKLTDAVANGNLSIRGNSDSFKGEFKSIVFGINEMLENIIKPLDECMLCLKAMAQGDLTVEMSGQYSGDYLTLKESVNKTVGSINEILGHVKTTVEQVNSGANQVADASQSLSRSSTEAASSLEEISSSMQQMSAQVNHNTESVVTANQVSNQAKVTAENGNAKMTEMVKAMAEINQSAGNISKIIKAIDEIAFQTNLLALNAAVEAARAGKHGKGFTVVAEEVRNLAQRSAKAAKETAEMIENAINKTEVGTKIADETAKVLVEIANGSIKSTDLMGEIAAASKEQAQGLSQMTQGMSQLDRVTQQNTSTAEQAAAASEELSGQAKALNEMINKFKLKNIDKTVNAYVSKNTLTKKSDEKAINNNLNGKKAEYQKMIGNRKNVSQPQIILDDKEFGKF
ncbi:MAG: methyl-accepting chemotaxis protein [Candidatus Wallbacteria bacterium]